MASRPVALCIMHILMRLGCIAKCCNVILSFSFLFRNGLSDIRQYAVLTIFSANRVQFILQKLINEFFELQAISINFQLSNLRNMPRKLCKIKRNVKHNDRPRFLCNSLVTNLKTMHCSKTVYCSIAWNAQHICDFYAALEKEKILKRFLSCDWTDQHNVQYVINTLNRIKHTHLGIRCPFSYLAPDECKQEQTERVVTYHKRSQERRFKDAEDWIAGNGKSLKINKDTRHSTLWNMVLTVYDHLVAAQEKRGRDGKLSLQHDRKLRALAKELVTKCVLTLTHCLTPEDFHRKRSQFLKRLPVLDGILKSSDILWGNLVAERGRDFTRDECWTIFHDCKRRRRIGGGSTRDWIYRAYCYTQSNMNAVCILRYIETVCIPHNSICTLMIRCW